MDSILGWRTKVLHAACHGQKKKKKTRTRSASVYGEGGKDRLISFPIRLYLSKVFIGISIGISVGLSEREVFLKAQYHYHTLKKKAWFIHNQAFHIQPTGYSQISSQCSNVSECLNYYTVLLWSGSIWASDIVIRWYGSSVSLNLPIFLASYVLKRRLTCPVESPVSQILHSTVWFTMFLHPPYFLWLGS